MRQWTATHMAKLARKASRAVGKKGTDLPGQIARRVDQNILRKLSEQVDDIVFISGTNGKTTTSNLIGHTLKENQIKIIHNNEGANMAAGITLVYYGMKAHAHEFEQSTMNESKYCPNCGRLLQYDYIHYNQIGHYHCECGFKREEPTYEVSNFEVSPFINMTINDFTFNMKIAGDFNAFNALAAYSVLRELGLNDESIQKGFETYTSDNGRMQYFSKGNKEAMINLAKNPAGMNASLSVGEQLEGKKVYVISLNDNAADGRDTSWIYDADFEKLSNQDIEAIIVTGTRAEELQLRLKLAEVDVPIIVENDIYKATAKTMDYTSFTVAIPNYTSLAPMLEQLNRSFEGGQS